MCVRVCFNGTRNGVAAAAATTAAVADKSKAAAQCIHKSHRYQDSLRVCAHVKRVCVCVAANMLSSLLFYSIRDYSRAPSEFVVLFFYVGFALIARSRSPSCHFMPLCATVRCCCSNVLFTCLPALKCLFIRSPLALFSPNQVPWIFRPKKWMSGPRVLQQQYNAQSHARFRFHLGLIVLR